MLYLIASLEIQDPKKRFIDIKCNQNISKKLSVANTVYRLSRLKYNEKIFKNGSSSRIAL